MSLMLVLMVYWHSGHHVAKLKIIPDLADELVITTHTMFGGEKEKTVMLYQLVNKSGGTVRAAALVSVCFGVCTSVLVI